MVMHLFLMCQNVICKACLLPVGQVLKPELHNKVWVKAFQLIIKESRSCTLNPNRKVLYCILIMKGKVN